MPLNVSDQGLNWALANLKLRGTCDLLPMSPFVSAISANWPYVGPKLRQVNLEGYIPSSPRLVFAPKSATSFRICHDLDPIDHLLMTGLIFDQGGKIEGSRDPIENARVFSDRFEPKPNGEMFRSNSYECFRSRSLELSKEPGTQYVVCLDLVDCYNQLSTHLIENALQSSGISTDTSKAIEQILLSLALRTSRGLPVGQDFGRILAEIALNVIDQDLQQRGVKYVRYVDDFRIFCPDYESSLRAIHDFSKLINQDILKLALNDQKTRVYKTAKFQSLESVDPSMREKSERFKRYREKVTSALDWIQSEWSDPYSTPPVAEQDLCEVWLKQQKLIAAQESLDELFDEALLSETPDYQMIRHLLVSCTRRRRSELIEKVTSQFERLIPIMRFACDYMVAVAPDFTDLSKQQLRNFCDSGPKAFLPYTREWLASAMVLQPGLVPTGEATRILQGWGAEAQQFQFMANIISKSPTALRTHKQEWKNLGYLQRRWFVRASEVFPNSERVAFWKEVLNGDDAVERSIVAQLKSK